MKKTFGESAEYHEGNESERSEAKQYLNLWKKFFLRKLQRDSYEVTIVDEQWVERPSVCVGSLATNATIGLKICIEGKYFYDLENR